MTNIKPKSIIKKILWIFPVLFLLLAAAPNDKFFDIAKNLDIFATLFQEINRYYVDDLHPDHLINTGIGAMLENLDPYTTFIPEEDVEGYLSMTTGEYGGIGVTIGQLEGKVFVVMVNEGFAAEKAGIKVGDELLEIGGQSVVAQPTYEISKLLRGQSNTEVKLKVLRYGKTTPVEINLKRENIHNLNVPYYGMLTSEIGFIQLNDFTRNASKEVKNALAELKKQGATKLILDLRGNPGGLLNEAINISNLFIPKNAEIVSTKGKISEWNKTYKALNQPADLEIPLVVLINQQSASASEIVAGVMQDYDRGVVIGRRSFGKGLVQATRPLSYNTKLKVTVAKYYIPSGRCIQEIDYTHRTNEGLADKLPDSLRTAFLTKNKRTVYDGGGILPDIEVEERKLAPITKSILQNGLHFQYANHFASRVEQIAPARDFALSDQEYQEFAEWLTNKDFDYQTQVEVSLDNLVASAKSDKYYEDVKSQIEALTKKVYHNKDADLQQFKAEIKELLEIEIAKRYYFNRGMVEVVLDEDQDLNKAKEILSDTKQYNEILGIK